MEIEINTPVKPKPWDGLTGYTEFEPSGDITYHIYFSGNDPVDTELKKTKEFKKFQKALVDLHAKAIEL